MSKTKKAYSKWYQLTNQQKLLNRCKQLSQIFININHTIKSVSDSAFTSQKDNDLKIKSIQKIFDNLSLGLKESFQRWRKNVKIHKYIG